MKDALIQHIKQIFEALKINAEYSVFDSANDMLPGWLQSVELTNEFVVCCEATFDKYSLQGFIHKELFNKDNHYYWFEGELIKGNVPTNEIIASPSVAQLKHKLKSSTRLSAWLDNYILGTLKAQYAPDFQRFEYNLNLSHEENLKYLGTYFPRSYAETFCIFDNIFANDVIKTKYALIDEVSILSVGCGTGGDIVGLITVLNKHFSSVKKVNVVAVDGNKDALEILSQIIQQQKQQLRKEINLTTRQVTFNAITPINTNASFDFIITSKFINEIINKGNGSLDNSYYDFASSFTPMLNENGIMMILDVTTKVGVSEFCPILLNRQINKFVNEYPDFVSIIPIPCIGKDNCHEQCFSQKEFSVSHSKVTNDKSRVAYRILVKKAFFTALQLVRQDRDTRYQIHPEKYCGQGDFVVDGFYLPNTAPVVNCDAVNNGKTKNDVKQQEVVQNVQLLKKEHIKVREESSEEKSNTTQHIQLGEAYVIDTNAFIYAPNIIEKIAEEYPIFVSVKVVDELDHRKDVTSGNDKKKVQKALKSINMAISSGRVQTATSDARLLPADFDRRSPDNLILSVVLKVKRMGYTPVLVTSDNGFQAKAKTLKIKTIPYTKVKSKI